MSLPKLALLILSFLPLCYCQAQTDSVITSLQQFPAKYLKQIDNKIDKYSTRLTSKTEKTLTKLSRWEDKIHALLLKASPKTATRLFAPGQPTFNTLLQKLKQGEAIEQNYKAQYNDYRDKLTTGLKYIQVQEEIVDRVSRVNKVEKVNKELSSLDTTVANSEAVEKFIKERKKQLINESIKYIGKSKYLSKINKEAYYYAETLKNYKEIFSDPKKVEEITMKILNKIPGFEKFTQQNSQLSGLFVSPASFPVIAPGAAVPIVNGLPTRAVMQQYMQANIPTIAGGNVSQYLQGSVSALKSQLDKIRSYASGGNQNNDGLPDFKPNSQKAKPFFKRFEYGTDIQFGKNIYFLPTTANVGFSLGYKFNDNNSAGIGAGYLLGMGKGWNDIRFTNEGLSLRTYVKSKLKKGFSLQGGSEWNYNFHFDKISQLKNAANWQQKALLGFSKSLTAGKKVKSNIQLLYDFLYNKHVPVVQPFIFRYGYSFK